jgi:hypothetical protein
VEAGDGAGEEGVGGDFIKWVDGLRRSAGRRWVVGSFAALAPRPGDEVLSWYNDLLVHLQQGLLRLFVHLSADLEGLQRDIEECAAQSRQEKRIRLQRKEKGSNLNQDTSSVMQ